MGMIANPKLLNNFNYFNAAGLGKAWLGKAGLGKSRQGKALR